VADAGDDEAVAALLGRPPLGAFTVVVRRTDGAPAVIENAPLLDDGRPMPTRYWLVDAPLREAVSRLEAAGGVRRAESAVSPAAVAEAHARHAAERDRALPPGHSGPAPSGGVGGTRRGVKCLHAHLAWYLAGGDDPVGRWTAEQLAVDVTSFVVEAADMQDPPGPVAAVDCGTNSTRLIVVAPNGTVLKREMRITRLGEGVDATRLLSRGAIDRTATVLREFTGSMDRYGVTRSRVVATSAVRDAENADQFMTLAEEITGVHPEVLSGNEEGRLSFAGATAHLNPALTGAGPLLVVDIGGGSTELAVGRPGGHRDTRALQVVARSLDIGCVRVSERFHHDPPSRQDLEAARRAVTEEVAAARLALPSPAPDGLMIGLAGTVSTLVCLDRGLTVYDRDQVHLAVLSRHDVERWLEVLAAEESRARLARPGMTPGREDVIVGGVLVLAVVMASFDRDRCLVSEDDILDGLAASLL
jgi:exopolyphosphatase / guanosine-5'-triphosphate,3'-diphosphate pyrophosphatase